MILIRTFSIASLVAMAIASPAKADELFVGIASQDLVSPIALDTGADGLDFQLGYRGDRIEALTFIGKPSPYIFAAVNSAGDTSFGAVGLSWKIGDRIYARPAIGIAIHDGPKLEFASDGSQTQLGSRILFAPELALGIRLSEKIDLEASLVHLSHAGLFSRVQNPGLDMIGARLVLRLP